jgi:hypothetical protein
MKLFQELNEDVHVLVENDQSGVKQYFIEGVFLQGEVRNKNNRVYPIDILAEKVQNYLDEYVTQNRAFGELGHPAGPTINLDRVSHMIKSLVREKNDFIGKAKILDTPYGKIAKNLLDEGGKLGVSSRSLGSLHEAHDGTMYVKNDLSIRTAADIVADPSAPKAFVRSIMEGAEWVYIPGKGWCEQFIEQSKKTISKTPTRQLEAESLRIFEQYLNKICENSKIS